MDPPYMGLFGTSMDSSRDRTVCISNLPTQVTPHDVLKQVRSGPVTHVTQGVMGQGLQVQMLFITFLTTKAAKDCIHHLMTLHEGVDLPAEWGNNMAVNPKPLSPVPMKAHWHHAIETNTVSRILLLTDLNPATQHLAIAEKLRNSAGDAHNKGLRQNDILAMEDVENADGARDVRVHFNSAKNAIRAYQVVIDNAFFLGCRVHFDADPCDPDGKERLLRQEATPAWVRDMWAAEPHESHHRSRPSKPPQMSWGQNEQKSGTLAKDWKAFANFKVQERKGRWRRNAQRAPWSDHRGSGEDVTADEALLGLGIDLGEDDEKFYDGVEGAYLSEAEDDFVDAVEFLGEEPTTAGELAVPVRRDSVITGDGDFSGSDIDPDWDIKLGPTVGNVERDTDAVVTDGDGEGSPLVGILIEGLGDVVVSPEAEQGAAMEVQEASLLD
ncbi:Hypothetical protein D9617_10g073840 [Elsinoe fawcettii]|nr:Hypothetical protein D9617_10g073840 [Elsinoe fawcettii]